MYQSVSPNVNFVEQEKKIEAFWEEEHIFEKSIDSRKKIRCSCVISRQQSDIFVHMQKDIGLTVKNLV